MNPVVMRVRALGGMKKLADTMCGVYDDFRDDPAPGRALHLWRSNAGI